MPVCVSFGFFTDHTYLLVDPTHHEEQVMNGKLIVGINSHREVCVLQLVGGVAVLPDQVCLLVPVLYLHESAHSVGNLCFCISNYPMHAQVQ